jgi:hypothetical protein
MITDSEPIKFDPAIFPIDPVIEAELRRDARRVFKDICHLYNEQIAKSIRVSSRERLEREIAECNRLIGVI